MPPPSPSALSDRRFRFLGSFFLLLVVLYALIAWRPAESAVVEPFTVGLTRLSGTILNLAGQETVTSGTMIRSPGFAVNIRNGCNGVEAVILLIAAMAAYPMAWRRRLLGIGVGFLVIQGFNLVRIASLFLIGRYHPDLFAIFHVAVWQIVMVLLSLGVFVYWIGRDEGMHAAAAR
jgi:exosortase H (IPTLxxWG-CTERM-specific)